MMKTLFHLTMINLIWQNSLECPAHHQLGHTAANKRYKKIKADLLDLPNVEEGIVHLLQVVDPAQRITQEITAYQMPAQEINTFSAEMSTEAVKVVALAPSETSCAVQLASSSPLTGHD
jgi:hypothetical protein